MILNTFNVQNLQKSESSEDKIEKLNHHRRLIQFPNEPPRNFLLILKVSTHRQTGWFTDHPQTSVGTHFGRFANRPNN